MDFFSFALASFAVPMFFAISGYLNAWKTDCGQMPGWYPLTLKKKWRTLGIPYLTWCTIYAVTFLPFNLLGNHLAGRALTCGNFLHEPLLSPGNLGRLYGLDIFSSPVAGVMWYVRSLIIFNIFSPLFFSVLRHRNTGLFFLFVSGFFFFFHDLIPGMEWFFLSRFFTIRWLFFYAFGAFCACYPVKYDSYFPFIRGLIPFVWIALSVLLVCQWVWEGNDNLIFKKILYKTVILSGIISIWYIYDMIPLFQRIGTCSCTKESFFVYAFHYLAGAILLCSRIQNFLVFRLHIPALGVYLLRFFVPLAASLLTANLLKRFLPRFYSLLTGGR